MSKNDVLSLQFAQTYWEKKPKVLKNVRSSLLEIGAEPIFELLVLYSDHCRKTRTTTGLKFYIDGQAQYLDEIIENLPRKTDRTLLGYHKRMSKRFSDYCLVCDELMQVSDKHWSRLGLFMQALYANVGMPNRFSEIGLYLGNYRKTPFGVHVDGCGVLSVPVVGRKKFRLWTAEFIKKNPDLKEAHSYGNYLKHSSTLVAQPGDITYWPSSYWHIAESDGSFSATWSIGIWVDQPLSELLLQILKPLVIKKLKINASKKMIRSKNISRKNGLIEMPPPILDQAAAALSDLSDQDVRDALLCHWLEVSSKNGFKNAPRPMAKSKLKRSDRLQRKSPQPILWAHLASGMICAAVNGVRTELLASPKNLKLIEDLNAGNVCSGKSQSEEGFRFLQTLYQNHGAIKLA